jgi:Uma2 family endonuclease
MGRASRKLPNFMTVDEFYAWPGDGKGGKYELVDGELRTMSPAYPVHSAIQSNLHYRMSSHLDVAGGKCRVYVEPAIEVRIRANINTRVPDLGVSCAKLTVNVSALPDPILLVEVLSPSNMADTWNNVWAYTTIPSVQEILIVQSTRIEAQLLRRDARGAWPADPTLITGDGTLTLNSIDLTLPLRDAYARTYLVES